MEFGTFMEWWTTKIGDSWNVWFGPIPCGITFRTKREAVQFAKRVTREFDKQIRHAPAPSTAHGIGEILEAFNRTKKHAEWSEAVNLTVDIRNCLMGIAEQIGYTVPPRLAVK